MAVAAFNPDNNDHGSKPTKDSTGSDKVRVHTPGHNKYRLISKHINKVFFVLMNVLWLVMTIWYFTFTNS